MIPPTLPAPGEPPRLRKPGLYLLEADGSSLRSVALDGVSVAAPYGRAAPLAWSPDGGHLAFIAAEDNRPYIVAVGAGPGQEMSPQRQVADGALDPAQGLIWSPDGDELLASAASGEIVRIPIDGSGATTVARPELPTGDTGLLAQFAGGAVWLPDGEGIIYSTLQKRAISVELVALRFDGTQQQQITDFPDELSVVAPNPSPDGQQLSAHMLTDDWCFTVIMKSDGTVTDIPPYFCGAIVWSPDSQWILTSQYVGDGDATLLLDSTVNPGSFFSPVEASADIATWGPESDRFAFVSTGWQGGGAISVTSRSGAMPVVIAELKSGLEPQALAWSPVDDRLAVLVGEIE